MDELTARLASAKHDTHELNKLISDYIPYIKNIVVKNPVFGMEFDDRLSIAMLVFMNCVRQYDDQKGSFLSFANVCIRNRLIDEGKKQKRHDAKVVPLFTEHDESSEHENSVSFEEYNKEQERLVLSDEIDMLAVRLEDFNIKISTLADICPKQDRSRQLCIRLAEETISNNEMEEALFKHKKLSQKELANISGKSEKTIEKHRRFIIVLAVIMSGDYPGISSFLPDAKGGR